MGIESILILTVMACTFTATSEEGSVSSFDQTTEQPEYDEYFYQMSDELDFYRGRESSVSSFDQTNERPEDESSTQMFEKFEDKPVFCSFAIIRIHPLDQAMPNCSSLFISNKTVNFLKGLLVTRLLPSFYIIIILISLPLYALALVAFTCRIREKKPAVIYMSHLACVDLLFTLLLPLKIHYQLNASDWVFGEALCRVLSAAYYCYMYCSILLMMCMSVDRLLAVVFPITSLTWRSTRKATLICILSWLLALAGTVPLLSMRQTFEIEDVGVTCHDALIHNNPTDQQYMYQFSILSCVYYFVPFIVTLVSYSSVIKVLHMKPNFSATTSPSSSDQRRRAVIMAIVVLIEFVVCFAPSNGVLLYHCFLLATGFNRGEGDSSYAVYLVAVCLGSASVFLDPLLYYYGSSQCRRKMCSLLRRGKAEQTNTQTKSSQVCRKVFSV